MSLGILDFEFNSWWIVAALGLGIVYAIVMYSQQAPWGKSANIGRAILRFVLSSVVAFLLIGPTIHSSIFSTERPIMALAIDNSESMALVSDSVMLTDLKRNMSQVVEQLDNLGWETKLFTLNNQARSFDELEFDAIRSDLTGLMRRVQQENEGLNLAGIFLLSDGIYNSGYSPELISGLIPAYTMGVGDTTELKDLSIIDVRHNKTVFQGNSFPVEVDVRNTGISANRITISVTKNGKVLDSYNTAIDPSTRIITHRFLLEVGEGGKQRFTIQVTRHEDEFTFSNNRSIFYIDVIEGKQKILIVPGTIHPDIKAIKLSIEQNEHFEVELAKGGEAAEDYDLLIFYQYPGWQGKRSDYNQLINSTKTAKLIVAGLSTDMNWLRANGLLDFQLINRRGDLVTAYLTEPFSSFNLSEEILDWLPQNPPVSVPYGNIVLGANEIVMLKQQIGAVSTNKPLLFFKNTEPKTGFLLAENFWRWRLDEFRLETTQKKFDELISKTVQFLAAKPDNRQFKMYPVKEVFEAGEPAMLNSEMYNELFEPVYGNEIKLNISKEGTSEVSEYHFTPLPGSTQFNASELTEGVYSFRAETTMEAKKHRVNGQFIIEKLDLEAIDLTADYKVLRNIAEKSNGQFYQANQMDQFILDVQNIDAPAIIHTREKEQSLLNFYWLMVSVILLASAEWFFRKFFGGY